MDRAALEVLLARGLSLAEIGRRFSRHESTVAYWVQKHGLEAVNRDRCAARGGVTRGELETLVGAGLSIAQIAQEVHRSKSTVRHWLQEYGLVTKTAVRRQVMAGAGARVTLDCPVHGETEFGRRQGGGYRCLKCRSEAVVRRRRRVKQILVAEAGGVCQACGYDRCIGALHFHHTDRTQKSFMLSRRGATRSIERARAEAAKCVLLCSNCHVEVEAGVRSLS